MARETRQDRLLRSMQESVAEHLTEFKAVVANVNSKESDIEDWCGRVIRSCLGFSATNGYIVRAQEARGKMRPDLVILKGDKPICVIEVKKLGFDLDKSDFRSGRTQLQQYLATFPDVKWGILCNGYEWRLYDFSNVEAGGIEVLAIDLRSDSEDIELGKRAVDESCWELSDFHESSYSSGAWSDFAKEATAFSPESLARAILSADVVKLVAKTIRGEHEYKANIEVLTDRVYDLISNGLDDLLQGWNEVKQTEMQKYIKSQKRSSRRRKRAAKAETAPVAMSSPEVVAPTGPSMPASTESVAATLVVVADPADDSKKAA